MNKLFQQGHITRELELRFTPKGTPVLDFGIAVNRSWTDEQGQKREDVTFTDWRCWGKSAETLVKFFHKGKPILLEGRLAQEKWEDKKTGQPRSKTLAIVENWWFVGDSRTGPDSRAAGGGQRTARPAGGSPLAGSEAGENLTEGMEDDDIPF
jgi:single-strand DNA-binding protein